MKDSAELTVSFRRGRFLAAYLTLPREPEDQIAGSRQTPEGLVIDYGDDGRELGIEILDLRPETMEALSALMTELSVPDAEEVMRALRRQTAPAPAG